LVRLLTSLKRKPNQSYITKELNIKYIGLDVAKEKLAVSIVRQEMQQQDIME